MHKLKEWIKSYWKAELLSSIGSMLLPMIIAQYTVDTRLIALGGVIGDNVGYYGYFFFHDHKGLPYLRRIKLMMYEFGLAEVMDTFITRPLLMHTGYTYFGYKGMYIGKVLADIMFYTVVIPCRELLVKPRK